MGGNRVSTTPTSITTFTGIRMNPLDASPRDIDAYDIAHALARQCRYNGHVQGFLSVARHSLWVSDELLGYGRRWELWGLLHDASEAYLGDMVKPVKYQPEMQVFRDAELRLEEVIAERFDLPWPMPAEVKEADRVVTVDFEIGMNLRYTWDSTIANDEDEFLARYDELIARYRGRGE